MLITLVLRAYRNTSICLLYTSLESTKHRPHGHAERLKASCAARAPRSVIPCLLYTSYNSAVDQIALVEVGQSAIDHLVHLFVRDVLKINDGRVLDFGQNGPLSSTGTLLSLIHISS